MNCSIQKKSFFIKTVKIYYDSLKMIAMTISLNQALLEQIDDIKQTIDKAKELEKALNEAKN